MQNGNNNGKKNNDNNLNDVKNNQKIIDLNHISIIAEELLLSPSLYGKLRHIQLKVLLIPDFK